MARPQDLPGTDIAIRPQLWYFDYDTLNASLGAVERGKMNTGDRNAEKPAELEYAFERTRSKLGVLCICSSMLHKGRWVVPDNQPKATRADAR